MFETRGPVRGGPRHIFHRTLHMQNVGLGLPKLSLRHSLNLSRNPDLKLFFRLIKSPSHLFFFATNVAVLVHLKLLGTMNKKHRMEHLTLQPAELENYESVISNIDQEVENVKKQIEALKKRHKEDKPLDNIPQKANSLSEKHLKYMKIQQKVLKDQEFLAKRFTISRAAIASKLTQPENIARLFESESHGPIEKTTDVPLHKYELDPLQRQYSAPIRNLMMLLSHLMITSCLVELNIQYALHYMHLYDSYPSNSLCRPQLFASMKLDDEKLEMLQHLSQLRENAGSEFKELLSSTKVLDLMYYLRHSEHFASKEQRRYDMYIHKSGRWQNYDNSDTHKYIQGIQGPVFRSNIVDDHEYFEKFKELFSGYKKSKYKLKHISLVLEISKILGKGGERIPTNAIFRYLFDSFGTCGLFHFQSLVYDHLPSFKLRETAWADGVYSHSFADRDVLHFHRLIEEDPQLLGSLIKYHKEKGDTRLVQSLLRYLEPSHNKILYVESILPSFMTKIPNSQLAGPGQILKEPILFRKSVLEEAMAACLYFNDYKSIDRLLMKLVFSLVETPAGLMVSTAENLASKELVLNNYGSQEAINKLFNENIFYMLAKAYVEQNDQQRCEWLAPHMKNYMKKKPTERLHLIYNQVLKVSETLRIVEHVPSRSQNSASQKKPLPRKTKFGGEESMHVIDSATT